MNFDDKDAFRLRVDDDHLGVDNANAFLLVVIDGKGSESLGHVLHLHRVAVELQELEHNKRVFSNVNDSFQIGFQFKLSLV